MTLPHFLTSAPPRGVCRSILVLAALASAPWYATAHEGEDHASETPAAISTAVAPRAYAQTEDFELVAQLSGTELRIHLDRFATNEPVANAQIEVESGTALKAPAQQTAPGVYTVHAQALATPGQHALSFSIQTDDTADLLAATLDTAAATPGVAHTHGRSEWASWGLSGAFLATGLALVVMRRRRRARQHPR